MGSSQSVTPLSEEEIMLSQETGFDRNRIKMLRARFQQLDHDGKGYIEEGDLDHDCSINPLASRVVKAFFYPPNDMNHPDTLPLLRVSIFVFHM